MHISGTLALGIFAAVVGLLSLGWQVYTYRREHVTTLTITPELGVFGLPGGAGPGGTQDALAIHIHNRSKRVVTITEAGMRVEGSSWSPLKLDPGALPQAIPVDEVQTLLVRRMITVQVPMSAGSWQTWCRAVDDPLASIGTEKAMTFYVLTENGHRFTSKPVRVQPERFV